MSLIIEQTLIWFLSFSVSFEFQHNVCGRSIYAEGTVDAILFLAKKVNQTYKSFSLLPFHHVSQGTQSVRIE